MLYDPYSTQKEINAIIVWINDLISIEYLELINILNLVNNKISKLGIFYMVEYE